MAEKIHELSASPKKSHFSEADRGRLPARGLEDRARYDRPDTVFASTMEDQEALRASESNLAKKIKISNKLVQGIANVETLIS
ncbi:hypothetical protein DSO57_1028177 [Entomophthora muscae]|uniref:Uncharacterized protein n=1 Tax=Entomophthora muscae TaxID=34485 RepID=A0ACC2UMC8_9FUNG|nr:hypothetical protein DSO57_1028177 [Entomophthora muscae]